jgi:hypothetical protein
MGSRFVDASGGENPRSLTSDPARIAGCNDTILGDQCGAMFDRRRLIVLGVGYA